MSYVQTEIWMDRQYDGTRASSTFMIKHTLVCERKHTTSGTLQSRIGNYFMLYGVGHVNKKASWAGVGRWYLIPSDYTQNTWIFGRRVRILTSNFDVLSEYEYTRIISFYVLVIFHESITRFFNLFTGRISSINTDSFATSPASSKQLLEPSPSILFLHLYLSYYL